MTLHTDAREDLESFSFLDNSLRLVLSSVNLQEETAEERENEVLFNELRIKNLNTRGNLNLIMQDPFKVISKTKSTIL